MVERFTGLTTSKSTRWISPIINLAAAREALKEKARSTYHELCEKEEQEAPSTQLRKTVPLSIF